ncbi:polysaccharide biosynthesis/export family protein [Paraburkholderia sp. BL6669N2]|uniref:polysaccharide biosynthesis/export family protein n=1 Tax=Paraburkholderia sp. BL6669N2 TaxID=1938807 RepID=UPI0021629C3A|nr:polysaccharide biosynthesis/export family protein [Paraburkholderia sp. BL6669N2]
MRMSQPAQLPVTDATSAGGVRQLDIPIEEINLSLIKQLRDQATNQQSPAVLALLSQPKEKYTVGIGDVLQITVWDHPEFAEAVGAQPNTVARASDPSQGVIVDQDGNIQFPYVGVLRAAGLRTEEIQRSLTGSLSRYFTHPQVTVRIASFRSKKIYLDGEVHNPGAVPLTDIPMNFFEAVAGGGGFTAGADQSRVVVVRRGATYRIDFPKMLEKGVNPAQLILRDGDFVRVLARDDNNIFVMGEVTKPAIAVPMKDGEITLSQAIAQAGSINSNTADAAQFYVIRGSMNGTPQVFHLNASSPVSMVLANEFPLEPKDIVYVDGNGLVRISRVLNLLLPAINAGLAGVYYTK